MKENQLPVHNTSAEETGRTRPAVDSGDARVHISGEQVMDVAVADDSSGSVQITLAHCSAGGSASATSADEVTPRALPGSRNQYLANDTDHQPELVEVRDPKLEKWLLAAALLSVTTLFTSLYSISNPERVPSFVAQTVKISKRLSAGIKRRVVTTFGGTVFARKAGGTAIVDTAKAGTGVVSDAASIHGATTGFNPASPGRPKDDTTEYGATGNSEVQGVSPVVPASLTEVDHSPAPGADSTGGAHRAISSGGDETGTRHNSRVTEMSKFAEVKYSK